jgi:hypothetical protein
MNISYFIFAEALPITSEEILARRGPSDWSTFTVIVASCLVGLVAVLGIAFYYSRRQRRHPHHPHHHRPHHKESGSTSANKAGLAVESVADDGEVMRRRRRRRRRNHRPRNPTLAETGGLPPIRTEPPPGP